MGIPVHNLKDCVNIRNKLEKHEQQTRERMSGSFRLRVHWSEDCITHDQHCLLFNLHFSLEEQCRNAAMAPMKNCQLLRGHCSFYNFPIILRLMS